MTLQPQDFWSFSEWLLRPGSFLDSALLQGVALTVLVVVLGLLIGYLVSAIRRGPVEGFYSVAQVVRDFCVRDLPQTSARRVFALASLAVREAIRRKVLVAIGLFVVGLMFAGFMLDPRSDNPARLYISYVLTATNYLVLLLGLLISAFSLPEDIKNKTLYTIVTKPVRPTEIIAGRVIGFAAVGTLALVLMGGASYLFVQRSINHTHTATSARNGNLIEGETSYDSNHRHSFTLDADGNGLTDMQRGHQHLVSEGGNIVGPPIGALLARVPVYGELAFFDKTGKLTEKGINVGYEETSGGYADSSVSRWLGKSKAPQRSQHAYIEGATLSSAVYSFTDIFQPRFDEGDKGIWVQMSLRAYRSFKGEIEIPVRGTITLRNPDKPNIVSQPIEFRIKEYLLDEHYVPADLAITVDSKVKKDPNLYKDLVTEDGRTEVVIRCIDRGQYLGMTQGDVYLKAAESSFGWNLTKCFFCMWLQMLVVISLGVMFSTFLNGPVAMITTLVCLVIGFSAESVFALSIGDTPGGGPLESMIRLVKQDAMTTDLDVESSSKLVITVIDTIAMKVLDAAATSLPNLPKMDTSDFVASGFDVFGGLVARFTATTLVYVLAAGLIGYFFLKTREVAG